MNRQIQIFGDSIMRGVVLGEDRKYHLGDCANINAFSSEFSVNVVNRSSFGCTITKGFRQLKRVLDGGDRGDLVLLEYGGNDCDFDWAQVAAAPEAAHLPKTPVDVFESTLVSAVGALRDSGMTPVLMSLPPIDAEKYIAWITKDGLSRENIIRWLGDTQMIYRFQEMYSNVTAAVSRACSTLFVDVRSAFLARHDFDALLCEDGIHPSVQGQQLIRSTFCEFFARRPELLKA